MPPARAACTQSWCWPLSVSDGSPWSQLSYSISDPSVQANPSSNSIKLHGFGATFSFTEHTCKDFFHFIWTTYQYIYISNHLLRVQLPLWLLDIFWCLSFYLTNSLLTASWSLELSRNLSSGGVNLVTPETFVLLVRKISPPSLFLCLPVSLFLLSRSSRPFSGLVLEIERVIRNVWFVSNFERTWIQNIWNCRHTATILVEWYFKSFWHRPLL